MQVIELSAFGLDKLAVIDADQPEAARERRWCASSQPR